MNCDIINLASGTGSKELIEPVNRVICDPFDAVTAPVHSRADKLETLAGGNRFKAGPCCCGLGRGHVGLGQEIWFVEPKKIQAAGRYPVFKIGEV